MPPIRDWIRAQPPNYDVNIDKLYPYSEVPHIGEYRLVKIPIKDELIDLVDYWGEGRIEYEDKVTGFIDCYNVNHEYQLVSNGKDRNKKIPNRIPVMNYLNCSTSSYIKDDSVRNVTVMAAPINKNCSDDICRIVNEQDGKVVIYGYEENSNYVRVLERELRRKSILFCYGYSLPEHFNGLTLFDSYRAYLNKTELRDVLYKNVKEGLIDVAIKITLNIFELEKEDIFKNTLNLLIKNDINNLMFYIYKLWQNDKELVGKYLPNEFILLFKREKVKIVNILHDIALKIKEDVNSLIWGDAERLSEEQLQWKFTPILKDDRILFEIENVKFGSKIALEKKANEYGDRLCYGDNNSSAENLFILRPIEKNTEVAFLMFDNVTGQSLSLDASTDQYGNRKLWANDYFVETDHQRFGWHIQASETNKGQ